MIATIKHDGYRWDGKQIRALSIGRKINQSPEIRATDIALISKAYDSLAKQPELNDKLSFTDCARTIVQDHDRLIESYT